MTTKIIAGRPYRILVLSDSLALPRSIPEKVDFESTWVELLRHNMPNINVHQFSLGAATIDKLWEQFFFHKDFRPDLCILQCGINDCSPRALTEFEQILINSNRFTRKIGNILIPKFKLFLRRHRYVKYTSESKFRKILMNFFSNEMNIIALGIIPACHDYEKKVPGITRNIKNYNVILSEVVGNGYIDNSDIEEIHLMSDHHHLNAIGHSIIYEKIAAKIGQFYNLNN